uniref:PX domain-containing protein n=1 Tax=Eptatretus burgeri TaxID=7764 RepID=A0A8C4Q2M3_EPTBU
RIVVWKRYNDFKKLHKELLTIHKNLFRRSEEFPPFSKGTVFGRFEETVIEERRQCAEDLLQFSANIPALYNSQHMRQFFEVSNTRVDLLLLPVEQLQKVRCEDVFFTALVVFPPWTKCNCSLLDDGVLSTTLETAHKEGSHFVQVVVVKVRTGSGTFVWSPDGEILMTDLTTHDKGFYRVSLQFQTFRVKLHFLRLVRGYCLS